MDIVERLRLTDQPLNEEAASEIVGLRAHAVKMRRVCQDLAERLHAIYPSSSCREDAEIARKTLH
jgi:hypothetical protein